MSTIDTSGLSVQERGILASGAVQKYATDRTLTERQLVAVNQPSVRRGRTRPYFSRGQMFCLQWEDAGQPLPSWFDPVMQGFADLLTLPPNWDTYGAEPIDHTAIQRALDVVEALLPTNAVPPRVVPLSSSGLQFEWHRKGSDLEIVFDVGEDPVVSYRGPTDEFELPLLPNLTKVRGVIEKLV